MRFSSTSCSLRAAAPLGFLPQRTDFQTQAGHVSAPPSFPSPSLKLKLSRFSISSFLFLLSPRESPGCFPALRAAAEPGSPQRDRGQVRRRQTAGTKRKAQALNTRQRQARNTRLRHRAPLVRRPGYQSSGAQLPPSPTRELKAVRLSQTGSSERNAAAGLRRAARSQQRRARRRLPAAGHLRCSPAARRTRSAPPAGARPRPPPPRGHRRRPRSCGTTDGSRGGRTGRLRAALRPGPSS